MTYFLMGHRGTGKSSWLRALQKDPRMKDWRILDLDQEIQARHGDIAEIFKDLGESYFRELEFLVLHELLQKGEANAVIALGAGFQVQKWKELHPQHKHQWIWLRRESDEHGRIFLNRPRLDADLSSLEEFAKRFEVRDPVFREAADWVIESPEGDSAEAMKLQTDLLLGQARFTGSVIFSASSVKELGMIERLLEMGVTAIELRTDQLSIEDFDQFLGKIPAEKRLIAFRGGQADLLARSQSVYDSAWGVDWALEEGAPPSGLPISIISVHDTRGVSAFKDYPKVHAKWAPLVENWRELLAGFEWQQADPKNRSFLPRSENGRWNWFRSYMKGRQKINFIRQPQSDVKDQPTQMEWLMARENADFAAVLGSPVWQSFSPTEHQGFFSERGKSFFRIRVTEEEWDEAFPVLTRLGLVAAAVTSPLKFAANRVQGPTSVRAELLGAVNTLRRVSATEFAKHNTDESGLAQAAEALKSLSPVLIWGGGGTLSMLKALWPEAHAYGMRSSAPRDGEFELFSKPRLLIWAAGPLDQMPPEELWPEIVLDLNYREDSLARELSIRSGARYISGLEFFRAQAADQRAFWAADDLSDYISFGV